MPLKVSEVTRIFEDVYPLRGDRQKENTPTALTDRHYNSRSAAHKKTSSTTSFKQFFAGKDKSYDKENVDGDDDRPSSPKKSKSSTNIAGLLKKRSKKDLTDAERPTKTPIASPGKTKTPLWAQFATQPIQDQDGTELYPTNYGRPSSDVPSPTPQLSSQHAEMGSHAYFDIAPELRMPQQPYLQRKGSRSSIFTEDLEGKHSMEMERPRSTDLSAARPDCPRQQSNLSQCDTVSSSEHTAREDRESKPRSRMFDIIGTLGKRNRDKADSSCGNNDNQAAAAAAAAARSQDLDSAFESVLEKNDIPHNLRDHMRNLKPEVKASLIHGARVGSASSGEDAARKKSTSENDERPGSNEGHPDVHSRSRSRSRPRSGVFSISRKVKEASNISDSSIRSRSKSRTRSKSQDGGRPLSSVSNASATSLASLAPKDSASTPGDFIHYLTEVQKPELVEVGKVHKLRISLRVESVQWTDSFVRQGGMAELASLLHRIMAMEWREEHEDNLLHETLLCLKTLSTTNLAMQRLAEAETDLLPALLQMLFDKERRGPAEFGTRLLIVQIIFAHLGATLHSTTPGQHETRAREVVALMRDVGLTDDKQPHPFLTEMHTSRPYRTWCKEIVNVTKEVFWIFLHHMTVVPVIQPPEKASFAQQFFPTSRAPHPAAPYVGGVEWEATQYLGAHLDLVNGLIASLSLPERIKLREELKQSGFEKIMGSHLRTCKEKFYSAVHDGLRLWVAAAKADGWEYEDVRAGPPRAESAVKSATAPQLDVQVSEGWS